MKRLLILLLLLLPGRGFAAEVYDRIALTVNNQAITLSEIESRAKELAATKGMTNSSEEARQQLRTAAVEQLINDALLVSRAMEKNIEINDASVEDELERFLKARAITRAGLDSLLEMEGISIVDYKARFKQHLMREQLVRLEVEAQVVLEDDEIRKIFEQNGGKTKAIHARHILFQLSENAPPHLVEEARLRAMEVRQKVLKGLRFADAARQFSEDPSATGNAGDLGFFTLGQMVPEFEQVAFNLPPLQISEPVRTKFGFHLIEVLEVRYDQAQSFEMIKEQFKRTAFKEAYEQRYQKFLAQLRSKAEIRDFR